MAAPTAGEAAAAPVAPTLEQLLAEIRAIPPVIGQVAGRVTDLEQAPPSSFLSAAAPLGQQTVSVAEFGATVASSAAVNGAAIQKAIAALEAKGPAGGVILFPERGVYLWSGLLVVKATDVTLRGQGGFTAGSGIGGAAYTAGTSLQYQGGAAVRAIDARNTFGFTLEHIAIYSNSKALGEEEGVLIDLSGSTLPRAYDFSLIATGAEGLTYKGVNGLYLAKAQLGTFTLGRIAGFQNGVLGRAAAAEESIGHTFNQVFFNACQKAAIRFPGEAWTFIGCIWEPGRNEKGEIIGANAFKTEAPFTIKSLTIIGGWMSGGVAKEKVGVQIEFLGENLTILGTALGQAETLINFIGKVNGANICCPIGIAVNGLNIAAAAKESVNITFEPTDVLEVTTQVLNPGNANLGSIFLPKAPINKPWGAIAEPAETLAGHQAALKAIRELLKNAGYTE